AGPFSVPPSYHVAAGVGDRNFPPPPLAGDGHAELVQRVPSADEDDVVPRLQVGLGPAVLGADRAVVHPGPGPAAAVADDVAATRLAVDHQVVARDAERLLVRQPEVVDVERLVLVRPRLPSDPERQAVDRQPLLGNAG